MAQLNNIVENLNSAKEFNSDFCEVASYLHKKEFKFKATYGRMSKKGILKESAIFEDGIHRIVIFGTGGKYDSHLVLELDKLEAQGL